MAAAKMLFSIAVSLLKQMSVLTDLWHIDFILPGNCERKIRMMMSPDIMWFTNKTET